jgi:hypothetical protein
LVALQFVPLAKLGLPFSFGAREFAGFMAVLFPFAFLVPAVFLAAGSAAKTAKEAQSSLAMGASLVGMLPLISFLRQTQAPWWDAWVPVNGQYAVLSKVLRSETIPALDWVAMYAIPVVGVVLGLAIFSQRLNNEKLLAGR